MNGNLGKDLHTALVIAGFDGSGGAGILADIKTFSSLGVYAVGVLTSVTVQNSQLVKETYHLDPLLVREQLEILWKDFKIEGVKVGMIGSGAVAETLVELFRELGVKNLVVDPVLVSSSGKKLLEDRGIEILRRELLPLVDVITPNLNEAEVLCDMKINNLRDMEACARKLLQMGAGSVVIKGGHLKGEKAVDLFFEGGDEVHFFVKEKIKGVSVHGTGCTFASALCAFLIKGFSRREAVFRAKEYTYNTIRHALKLGKGSFLPDHFWGFER